MVSGRPGTDELLPLPRNVELRLSTPYRQNTGHSACFNGRVTAVGRLSQGKADTAQSARRPRELTQRRQCQPMSSPSVKQTCVLIPLTLVLSSRSSCLMRKRGSLEMRDFLRTGLEDFWLPV